jgi:vesicle-fusing ATPase
VSARDAMPVAPFDPPPSLPAANLLYGEVAWVSDKPAQRELAANDVIERLLKDFTGQVLSVGQQLVFELQGLNLRLVVGTLLVDTTSATSNGGGGAAAGAGAGGHSSNSSTEVSRGFLADNTAFIFTNGGNAPIKITGQKGYATNQLFKSKNLNFQSLGIGGLDAQFDAIFRRAFASRVFPPAIVQRLGIHHVKGMLLFGPPGTGKTLIARQIGRMLNGREPKVVNGPEVLSKFVGQAEENIRALFGDAEAEYKDKGDASVRAVVVVCFE